MIAFLPLFLQGMPHGFSHLGFQVLITFLAELIERGTVRALARLSKQFMSFSPVFEVFSTQIYTLACVLS